MPRISRWSAATATVGLLCLALPALATPSMRCSKQSPAHRVALVELYTSEGCSSCPPADRWLGELAQRFSDQQLVALSLHVDYWDYIGWRDRFAQPQFTQRQRWLTQLAAASTIYTPEVFAGMKEYRGWQQPALFAARIEAINRLPAAAEIALQMQPAGDAAVDLEARFALREGAGSRATAEAIVVVYENQLRSEVRAGENRGANLQHERVVRFWSTPIALNTANGQTVWRQTLKLPADWQRGKLGLAAFVQDRQAGEVLQAMAMPACGGQQPDAAINS
ncbi:MAG: DUF1223 domain-containing protein [Candidatus Accumulibacter sp.]|uniref:DUF1223 domain-containing protein n=1 Tax=Accumulibacter sp. TaxID=2053492 RepID=UPI001A0ACF63|nr:DUF1223 domain-containing protein [Accumulibacter sp.]MBE2260417.1 DUF1223 domain-containing protein [Paracoccaceae bacterium]MCP5249233.1 DUF1223 domain-containing protein [Accumulibacter sp.]